MRLYRLAWHVALALALPACSRALPHPPYVGQPSTALVVVDSPPPPPRVETVPDRPTQTAVWIDGEWSWRGTRWAWMPGRWVEVPAGLRYSPWTARHGDDGAFYYAAGTWRDARGNEAPAPKPLAVAEAAEVAVVNAQGEIRARRSERLARPGRPRRRNGPGGRRPVSDSVVFAGMVLTFALALTAHVTIVFGLARRRPRWRALAALLVIPLAPYWAFREKMRVRAAVWVLGVLGYIAARILEKGD